VIRVIGVIAETGLESDVADICKCQPDALGLKLHFIRNVSGHP
jgi:hypothetical protein